MMKEVSRYSQSTRKEQNEFRSVCGQGENERIQFFGTFLPLTANNLI